MERRKIDEKPVVLDKINLEICGFGDPLSGDPRGVCTRQFSKHILWLCRKRPMTAAQIADELGMAVEYVEEELEILERGQDGRYGLLRRMENGMYAINFILFDREVMEEAAAIYGEYIPKVCSIIVDYINTHGEEYLAYPYLNKRVEENLVLWQQVSNILRQFQFTLQDKLSESCFCEIERSRRPFTVYGYDATEGYFQGEGSDGAEGYNVCGFSHVECHNIYNRWIDRHFDCELNIASDPLIQLALRSIEGLDVGALSEAERGYGAEAVECGYLRREGERLYTRILVSPKTVFHISNQLWKGYYDGEVFQIAWKLSRLFRRNIPRHLMEDYGYAVDLTSSQAVDALLGALVEQGLLIPPKNRVGAEGCWIFVS